MAGGRDAVAALVKAGFATLTGGPVSGAGSLLGAAAERWAKTDGQEQNALRSEIDQWATGRTDVGPAILDRAWTSATSILKSDGIRNSRWGELGLDPDRAASEVISSAHRVLGEIEEPAERDACEQIIRAFYRRLVEDPQMQPMLVVSALAELLRLARAGDPAVAELVRIGQLREDARLYLEALVEQLSLDPWPRDAQTGPTLSVTDLERQLRVKLTRPDGTPGGEERVEDADAVARRSERLVVLGGPGAGKTWLARRIARTSAQEALKQLAGGVRLEEIELPLYATCEAFLAAPGNAHAAAVDPALAAVPGVSDAAYERLRAYIRGRDSGVLLVLDSLDEAGPLPSTRRRIDAGLIAGWRTVLTTRPGSWTQQWGPAETSGGDTSGPHPRGLVVAELQGISSPEDVHAFIRAWFQSTDPAGGERLLDNLAENESARDLSTVPLFLTFLCLVAEEGGTPPATRAALLNDVVYRLLGGSWRTGRPEGFVEDLLSAARVMAWQASHDDPVTGLAAWADDVLVPLAADARTQEQLDVIAQRAGPPRSVDGVRCVPRRFVHRVVREHLVAAYVAGLTVDAAADVLVAHWWFDDTWAQIIPSAVALHPQRDQLLTLVLERTVMPDGAPWCQALTGITAMNLLMICAETQPNDWGDEPAGGRAHRRFLHQLRVRNAVRFPHLVASSRHWRDSNAAAVDEMLGAIQAWSASIPGAVPALVEALPRLAIGPLEQDRAVNVLLEEPIDVHPIAQASRVAILAQLARGSGARARVLSQTLQAIPGAHPFVVAARIMALPQLVDSPEERRRSVTAVLEAMARASADDVAGMARVLPLLVQGSEEQEPVLDAVLKAMPSADPLALAGLARAVPRFDAGPRKMAEARRVILEALLGAEPSVVAILAEGLLQLDASPEERVKALAAVSRALLVADPLALAGLAETLTTLEAGPQDRSQALSAILEALPRAEPYALIGLAKVLSQVAENAQERALAITAALSFLAGASPLAVSALAGALLPLGAGPEEKAEARRAVLDSLPDAAPYALVQLVEVLTWLDSTPEELAKAVPEVVGGVLRCGNLRDAAEVASLLSLLVAGPDDRAQAANVVLGALPDAAPIAVAALAGTLSDLRAGPEQRAIAQTAVQRSLPSADRDTVRALMKALRGISRPAWWQSVIAQRPL